MRAQSRWVAHIEMTLKTLSVGLCFWLVAGTAMSMTPGNIQDRAQFVNENNFSQQSQPSLDNFPQRYLKIHKNSIIISYSKCKLNSVSRKQFLLLSSLRLQSLLKSSFVQLALWPLLSHSKRTVCLKTLTMDVNANPSTPVQSNWWISVSRWAAATERFAVVGLLSLQRNRLLKPLLKLQWKFRQKTQLSLQLNLQPQKNLLWQSPLLSLLQRSSFRKNR